jgi:hypothetical protein
VYLPACKVGGSSGSAGHKQVEAEAEYTEYHPGGREVPARLKRKTGICHEINALSTSIVGIV